MRTDLPRHLARIITHCLQKDPQHRYQSARDVVNELNGLEREAKSDPRRSIEERYPSREHYVGLVTEAALRLASRGYVLETPCCISKYKNSAPV